MTVETATYISQLNATYPAAGDAKSEGDDHLRLTKSAIKATFPNLTAAPVTPTTAELNYVAGVTSALQTQLNAKAALTSPALTGVPTAPTAEPGTNTTQLATTAFVAAAGTLKADLASPALTGTPSAPTAAAGTSSTQLATTEFVATAAFQSIIAAGGIVVVAYDNRATLRVLSPADGDQCIVEGLGLFIWHPVALLDNDETSFATASGAWDMMATSPDYVAAFWENEVSDVQQRLTTFLTTFTAIQAKILKGNFTMSLTTLAALSSSPFTCTITGVTLGDRLVVTPGNLFGTSATDQACLGFVAYVSAPNTVTVSIRNASASAAAMTASTWNVTAFKP